ncbi:MAG: hypothetical protein EOO45_26805 [Flavobacterium sp.]|nr:MAG: hypothetical protein EOO45_26805 [Flavobacterium sp.]
MDNYTLVFVFDGNFDLPNDPEVRDKKVPEMVCEKFEERAFELVDFNLTQHYDDNYVEEYISDPYRHRSVVEIKLKLDMQALKSRDAIFDRALEALKKNKLTLCSAFENDNKKFDMLQSIICFEEKTFVDAESGIPATE